MKLRLVIALLFLTTAKLTMAQKSPQFKKGQDPKSAQQKWKLNPQMSDEFNGKKIDQNKWLITKATGWIGRAPGLFVDDAIQLKDGALLITNSMLAAPQTINGKEFTHGGGLVASKEAMTYGYYECEMKANKTFMSSTFWLINNSKDGSGCDKRTTELDIQECVGQVTSDAKWSQTFDQTMGSNTHSRNIPDGCDITKGSMGNKAPTSGKVYDDFHMYGVWWKNKSEVQFFLDGVMVGKVTPPADFDLPMYLRMVTETYDWNPVPADGGLTGSKADRTTTYNWVRSWSLVD